MKTRFWSLYALALAGEGLIGITVGKQSSASLTNVTDLVIDVKQHTTSINDAASNVTSTSTAAQNTTVEMLYKTNLDAIGSDLNTLNHVLVSGDFELADADILDALLNALLDGLESALVNIFNGLGLDDLDSQVLSLDSDLNALLAALGIVVDGVLAPGLENLIGSILNILAI